MTEKRLSDITVRVTDIFTHTKFYDCLFCHDGETVKCLDCEKTGTVYDLLDVIASLHNELYKEVTGEYYDYMYHWANLGYGGSPDDALFKGEKCPYDNKDCSKNGWFCDGCDRKKELLSKEKCDEWRKEMDSE